MILLLKRILGREPRHGRSGFEVEDKKVFQAFKSGNPPGSISGTGTTKKINRKEADSSAI